MFPQFPFKDKYQITQGYADNFNHYPEGHHGGLDIVPFSDTLGTYPAPIYPLFNGSTLYFTDTDPIKGEGIKERIVCDDALISYLKAQKVVPANYNGNVYLDILYWHIIQVLDKDGILTTDTPIAKAGNTGNVYHNGAPVPDNQKGVPPYLGLHLHLETVTTGNLITFNLDKDPRGRIDPKIIFNYKGDHVAKYIIDEGGKIGVLITEGFTFGGGFAKDQKALDELKSAFEFQGNESTIKLS